MRPRLHQPDILSTAARIRGTGWCIALSAERRCYIPCRARAVPLRSGGATAVLYALIDVAFITSQKWSSSYAGNSTYWNEQPGSYAVSSRRSRAAPTKMSAPTWQRPAFVSLCQLSAVSLKSILHGRAGIASSHGSFASRLCSLSHFTRIRRDLRVLSRWYLIVSVSRCLRTHGFAGGVTPATPHDI